MAQPSKAVINRSLNKLYCRYLISLRKDKDVEMIAFIEQNRHKGISATETMRKLYAKRKTLD